MSALARAQAMLDATHRQTYHEEDGKAIVRSYQDVEPHMEYAAKCRREDAERVGRFGSKGEFRRTMCMPFNIILGVAQRLGIPQGKIFDREYSQRIFEELKRPEFRAFRTVDDKRI